MAKRFSSREPLNNMQNSAIRFETNDTLVLSRKPLNDSRDWTILMTVNNGYLDFFRNWLWHFKKLNLSTSLIVVAQDDLIHKELMNSDVSILGEMTVERSVHVSINSSVNFQTQQFNMLVGKRPQHILDYLERGKNILYIDTDTVWLQAPFQYFTGDYDLWVQLDQGVSYCTGFMAVRTGANTIELIRAWRDRMIDLQNRMDDQNGFNGMVHNHESKVRIKGLDTKRFPDESQYFSNYNDKQREDAVVVHNNCIIGHASKLERFKHMKLWYEDKLNGTKLHD
ncbi:uncharacterized protein LOC128244484 [Mya arenaria]|uniref:uncharacterized protein LOC128244484 n=1 Tax=Mya arenaria TaxID=6604 RepID=UPI0022E0539F|nr:uncharacterized protein LOC128244484 [Mya arenaria]